MSAMTGVLIVVAIVAAIAIGAGLWLQQRSKRLQGKFGPEYERTLRETGSRLRAESQLEKREKRVEKLHLREISQTDRERFTSAWRAIQASFVDDPEGALAQADQLVGTVMVACGYPMADFDKRVEDISVDHGVVADNYRAAHAIAIRRARGEATTEEIRQAMIHYRTLFEDLLPAAVPEELKVRRATA